MVLLLTYEEGPSDLEPEVREKLEKILVQYRASAGVTEPFRRYGHFMTQYRLARKLLKIGLMVRFHSEERIFTRGNYMDYQLIDMALRSFVQEYGHYNFAYLIHPSVVRLRSMTSSTDRFSAAASCLSDQQPEREQNSLQPIYAPQYRAEQD